MRNVKQGGIKYHFWAFRMTWPGIEPRSPGPLVNTLLSRPMVRVEFISNGVAILYFISLGTIYYQISLVGRVFANGPKDQGFNPRLSHTKNSKAGTW